MWTRLTDFYLGAPFWIKLAISSLISAFVGATIMAFLSTYANYFYALRHGARVPVEGVPFLSFSVAVASAIIYSAPLLVVSFVYFIGFAIINVIRPGNHPVTLLQRTIVKTIGLFLFFAVLFLAFVIASAPEARQYTPVIIMLLFFLVFGSFFAFGYWLAKNRHVLREANFILFLIITLVLAGNMLFVPGRYDSFLRLTRFGGGLESTIHRDKGEPITAYLFLYTEKRVILYKPDTNSFLEIPADDVQSIEYSQFPKWKLPDIKLGEQLQYVR